MTDNDLKDKDLQQNNSANIFDDNFDLFNTSSDDLFNTPSEDLFTKRKEEHEEEPKEEVIEKNEKQETIDNKVVNQGFNSELELNNKKTNKKSTKNKEKTKKNSEKKEKKKKMSLKMKLIICGIVALIIIAGAITGGVLYYKKISIKLSTPTLKIEKLYNSVILEASINEKATGYEFVISQDDENPIILKSDSNKKELSLIEYKKLTVKVRCLGKVAKANSEYSIEQTIYNKIKLKMSTVFVDGLTEIKEEEKIISYQTNADMSDDVLSWQSVAGASKYYIYYRANIENDTVEKYEVAQAEGTVTFNLSQIYTNNGAGYYSISVVAVPENEEYYEISDYSDVKNIEYYTKQSNIVFAEFDTITNVLKFGVENGKVTSGKFALYLDYGVIEGIVEHQLISEDLLQQEFDFNGTETIMYSVDISEYINEGLEKMSMRVLGDGYYSTDSDIYVVFE